MKRRVAVILSLVIAIVLCVPSVPSFAAEIQGFVTSDSVSDYDFGPDIEWQMSLGGGLVDFTYHLDYECSSLFNVSNSVVDNFDLFSKISSFDYDLNDYFYVILGQPYLYSSSARGTVNVLLIDKTYISSNQSIFLWCSTNPENPTDGKASFVPFVFDTSVNDDSLFSLTSTVLNIQLSRNSVNTSEYTISNVQGTRKLNNCMQGQSVFNSVSLLYTNIPVCMFDYLSLKNSYYQASSDSVLQPNVSLPTWFYSNPIENVQTLEDVVLFDCQQLPYYNGSEIIIPEGGDSSTLESNENHLLLSNFNIQFCKPYSLIDIYSRAGGGYAAFTYDFDSWVNAHSSDYELNIITQIDVDGQTFTYPNVRNLDVSGVLVLPFSDLAPSYQWSNENLLFVEYPNKIFGNYQLGYIYSLTYQKYVANAERFLGSGRSNRLFFKGHNLQQDFDDIVSSQIEQLFTNVIHSNFKISFTVTMVDTVSGERSGSFVKTFDLLNGVYNVTSNTIQDNQNPFEYSDESPYLPIEDSGGGYGLATNNQNQLVNFQFPSDIELFIDNGFKQFLAWYETSHDTAYATNRFWSSMGIFEGNPATDLYSEYFGFLPDDFKALIFSCAGIGIVGGAFCILRRRLH